MNANLNKYNLNDSFKGSDAIVSLSAAEVHP